MQNDAPVAAVTNDVVATSNVVAANDNVYQDDDVYLDNSATDEHEVGHEYFYYSIIFTFLDFFYPFIIYFYCFFPNNQ